MLYKVYIYISRLYQIVSEARTTFQTTKTITYCNFKDLWNKKLFQNLIDKTKI